MAPQTLIACCEEAVPHGAKRGLGVLEPAGDSRGLKGEA